jgi:hypothetical protein
MASDQPAEVKDAASMAALPQQDPTLVREMVGASHGKMERVKELLQGQPRLANAAIDHGFGDWETALGAASHVGRRDIAELLLSHGARPDHLTWAMLGRLEALRSAIEASPGLERIRGPHGITLMAHARAGGDAAKPVVEYLTALGGADVSIESAPLALADRAAVVGIYGFGAGAGDHLEVYDSKNALWIRRGSEGSARGLTHRGERGFSPAGAPEVMVRFAPGVPAPELTITAPQLIVKARRV